MSGFAAVAAEGGSMKSGWFDSEIQFFLIAVRTVVSHDICAGHQSLEEGDLDTNPWLCHWSGRCFSR